MRRHSSGRLIRHRPPERACGLGKPHSASPTPTFSPAEAAITLSGVEDEVLGSVGVSRRAVGGLRTPGRSGPELCACLRLCRAAFKAHFPLSLGLLGPAPVKREMTPRAQLEPVSPILGVGVPDAGVVGAPLAGAVFAASNAREMSVHPFVDEAIGSGIRRHGGSYSGWGGRIGRRSLLPLFLMGLALAGAGGVAGCGVHQAQQESEAVSTAGNKFLEEEKREAPKVERATREVEEDARRAEQESG